MTFTREAIRELNPKPLSKQEEIRRKVLKAFTAKLYKQPESFFIEPGPKALKVSFLVYDSNEERPKYNT